MTGNAVMISYFHDVKSIASYHYCLNLINSLVSNGAFSLLSFEFTGILLLNHCAFFAAPMLIITSISFNGIYLILFLRLYLFFNWNFACFYDLQFGLSLLY